MKACRHIRRSQGSGKLSHRSCTRERAHFELPICNQKKKITLEKVTCHGCIHSFLKQSKSSGQRCDIFIRTIGRVGDLDCDLDCGASIRLDSAIQETPGGFFFKIKEQTNKKNPTWYACDRR